MTDIALPELATSAWHRFTRLSREVLFGIAEGFAAARRYDRLAAMNDAQLARMGLVREDVLWFAMYGERRRP
jgi:hypothetical protein